MTKVTFESLLEEKKKRAKNQIVGAYSGYFLIALFIIGGLVIGYQASQKQKQAEPIFKEFAKILEGRYSPEQIDSFMAMIQGQVIIERGFAFLAMLIGVILLMISPEERQKALDELEELNAVKIKSR